MVAANCGYYQKQINFIRRIFFSASTAFCKFYIYIYILYIYKCIFFQDTALDPGEDVALLSVSFEDAEATQVFPKLYLSPSIEQ